MSSLTQFLDSLSRALPGLPSTKEDLECQAYGTDWTRQNGKAAAVLFPRTTEDVKGILTLAFEHSVAIVPSGGRTGLAGGAVAAKGEVVLNLSKMNKIYPVDVLGKNIHCQAGAVTEMVHEAAAKEGLTWPIDLAAKGTSQIGGNLSTNAGGVRVIRYGMARRWVSALQVVLMGGEVLQLNGALEKNNSGYDLVQLFLGSEGTLGVITEATLKLTERPKETEVVLFAVKDWQSVAALLYETRKADFAIQAFEFFTEECLNNVVTKLKRPEPFTQRHAIYVLLEAELPSKDRDHFTSWLERVLGMDVIQDGRLAGSSSEKTDLWSLREGITESISHLGMVRKYDVAVPVAKMAAFMMEARRFFVDLKLDIDLFNFGHFGDGSPHFNLVKRPNISAEQFADQCLKFEAGFFPFLLNYNGSASAEHGIGNQKKGWVTLSRSAREMSLFKDIKRSLDPKNLLNPGKVFDL